MIYTLKNANAFINNEFIKTNIIIEDGLIKSIGNAIEGKAYDLNGKLLCPAFIDPHVHSREPGFTHKGSIKSESLAAAHGGYVKCFLMPNLKPVPATKEVLEEINQIIERDSIIEFKQIASITYDQSGKGTKLSNMEEINNLCVGFSDDGNGVENANTMYEAMVKANVLNKPIISHCEDKSLVRGGVVALGQYGAENSLPMIDPISEAVEVARNCLLAYKTGCHLHICHLSSSDSIDIIRYYKDKGANITCEVTPHQLTLTDMDIKNSNFKMNPPLSTKKDSEYLLKALNDGVISCIATDHAPHAKEEKEKGLLGAPFGIIGLETCFPVLYTKLVCENKMKLEDLLHNLSLNVAKAFKLENNEIEINKMANLTVIDLNSEIVVDEKFLLSLSKNSPYLNESLKGKVLATIMNGKFVYNKLEKE